MAPAVEIARFADIADDAITVVDVHGTPILLVRANEAVFAVQGICSHEGYPLDQADLESPYLTCSLHYSRFDVRDGSVIDPPAILPLASYPVRIVGDEVVLDLPNGPIPVNLSE